MLTRKIGQKLTLGVVLTILLVIVVFALFSIESQKRSLIAEVERHAAALSEHIKLDTSYDMLHNDVESIHNTIRNFRGQSGIDRVRVFNKSGEIMYSSEERDIGKMVDTQAESCFRCHAAGQPLEQLDMVERTRIFRPTAESPRFLGIINAIYNEESCWSAACHAHPESQTVLGVLDVTIPLDDVDANIRNSQLTIILFAVSAIVLLGLAVRFMVRTLIDKPVQELLKGTRNVASGNLSYRVEIDRNDELGMLASSFNNMTDKLAQARMQLFQSDKLASLGRLAAGVAHEINNPLTAVLTYSSFLKKRSSGQPDIQDDLEVIVSETIRCREIVKSLLDFARQTVPKKRKADINGILKRAVNVVENQLAIGRVELITDLEEDLPAITVDANQIQQVFINLLVNASDAIGENSGTIRLSSRAINLGPAGVLQIKRAQCSKRHDLIDRKERIDGNPAIRMDYRKGSEEGRIYLDPVYGSDHHRLGDMPAFGDGVELRCPECSISLVSEDERCPDCGGPVYAFEVPMKGLVNGCLRDGCGWQHWEEVDSSWDDKFVEIRVEDDGCGISRNQLASLFEPFATTKGQKGTGLGLAVSWGIVDNHNGTITVESEVDKGTVFIVRLPVMS
jgi:two-component system NtrC family sensor kinase